MLDCTLKERKKEKKNHLITDKIELKRTNNIQYSHLKIEKNCKWAQVTNYNSETNLPIHHFHPPVLKQDSLDWVLWVGALGGPAGFHLQEYIWCKCVIGLQGHLEEQEVLIPQFYGTLVGVVVRHVGVQRHGQPQLQRGAELNHRQGGEPRTTDGCISIFPYSMKWSLLSRLKYSQRGFKFFFKSRGLWYMLERRIFVSPLHAHTDLSVASVVSWVNALPDNF